MRKLSFCLAIVLFPLLSSADSISDQLFYDSIMRREMYFNDLDRAYSEQSDRRLKELLDSADRDAAQRRRNGEDMLRMLEERNRR